MMVLIGATIEFLASFDDLGAVGRRFISGSLAVLICTTALGLPQVGVGADGVRSKTGLTDPTLALGLSGISDWSAELPFLDLMKQARPWFAFQSGWSDLDYSGLLAGGYLDEHGWPTAIPQDMNGIRTVWAFASGTVGAEGPFVLTYEGSGSILVGGGARVVSSEPGRIEFTNPGGGTFWMNITATDPAHTGDYVRDIQVVPAKYEALADLGEIFNPDWLALVQDVRQVRFMDWMGTNGSTQSDWVDRPQIDDFSYSSYGRPTAGAPVEIMVALANKIGADPWFNIPHMATDEYVEQFATYVRDHLNAGLVAHVEYSNEMWNWQFQQTAWAQAQAEALWGTDKINFIPPNGLDYQAMRATQVATIWDNVFGDAGGTRVENVLGIQTGNGWWLKNRMLHGDVWHVKDPASYIDPASVLDAVAVTTYFGGAAISNLAQAQQLLSQISALGEEGAMTWYKNLLLSGAPDGINTIAGWWSAIKEITASNGLDLVAYEGGQHVDHGAFAAGLTTEQRDTLGNFMHAFVRSDQMAELYVELWNAWAQVSDGPFMQFGDVGAPGKSGSWGLLKDLADTNPRAKALFELNAQQDSWFGDGGGTRYQQGVIKLAGDGGETN